MKVGKLYIIIKSRNETWCPELSPQDIIVKCSEDCGNGYYKVKLEDKLGKKIKTRDGKQGWLIHPTNNNDLYKELTIRDIRKLKLDKLKLIYNEK